MTITLVAGLASGCVYALVAVGFSLIYRTTGIVNFAQGSFVMVGGMFAYAFLDRGHLPYALDVVLAVASTGLLGLVVWIAVVLPLWKRGSASYVIILATLVFGSLVADVVFHTLGSEPHTLPAWISGFSVPIGRISVNGQYVLVVGVTVLLMIGLSILLSRTMLGRAMRACAASRDTSSLLGISPERVGAVAMVLAAVLGGIGGALITPAQFTSWDAALPYGVYGFVAAVLGGFGSLGGSLLGGLLVGLIEALTARYVSSSYGTVMAFGMLLTLLFVRPQGLIGQKWD